MGYEHNLIENLDKIIAGENDGAISSFADMLRSNISKSVGLLIKSTTFTLTMILSHYLVSNGLIERINLGQNSIGDSQFIRISILVLALLGPLGMVLSDYMMRCYRAVSYTHLTLPTKA